MSKEALEGILFLYETSGLEESLARENQKFYFNLKSTLCKQDA